MIKGIQKVKEWLRTEADKEGYLAATVGNETEKLRHEDREGCYLRTLAKMREEGV